jgi:hypothetical protein
MSESKISKRIRERKPIEVWESHDGTWRWEVYQKYQKPENEAKNPYARWFCRVTSPFTSSTGDIGDVYVKDIKAYARQVYKEKEVSKKKLKKVM